MLRPAKVQPSRGWGLAMLLAALGSLGPFSIDTYLPAFTGIAASLQASPVQMQQTLSAYLLGFALMNLFHGALSDALGRRPVVAAGLVVYGLASVVCAWAPDIVVLIGGRAVQGMAAGAGVVIARAVIRDLYPPDDAQRMMSRVTLFFGIAPAVAPLAGGWLFVHWGWRSIFAVLAVLALAILVSMVVWMPESLPRHQRRPFRVSDLRKGYLDLARRSRFWGLALASGVPFNGMFVYVLSAPAYLGEVLQVPPTQFFWLFIGVIGGIMSGAWASGRWAGRVSGARQVGVGFSVMAMASAVNLGLGMAAAPRFATLVLPLMVYSFGWALVVPIVTLMVLDLVPQRRGMASSLQATVASVVNAIVAGAVSPWVMHSAIGLAWTSVAMAGIGYAAWRWAWRESTGSSESG